MHLHKSRGTRFARRVMDCLRNETLRSAGNSERLERAIVLSLSQRVQSNAGAGGGGARRARLGMGGAAERERRRAPVGVVAGALSCALTHLFISCHCHRAVHQQTQTPPQAPCRAPEMARRSVFGAERAGARYLVVIGDRIGGYRRGARIVRCSFSFSG